MPKTFDELKLGDTVYRVADGKVFEHTIAGETIRRVVGPGTVHESRSLRISGVWGMEFTAGGWLRSVFDDESEAEAAAARQKQEYARLEREGVLLELDHYQKRLAELEGE